MVSPSQGSPIASDAEIKQRVQSLVSVLSSIQKVPTSGVLTDNARINCDSPSAALQLFKAVGLEPGFDTRELSRKIQGAQAHLRPSSLKKYGFNHADSNDLIHTGLKLLEAALSNPTERRRLTDLAKKAPPPAPAPAPTPAPVAPTIQATPILPDLKLSKIDWGAEARKLEQENAKKEEAARKLAAEQATQRALSEKQRSVSEKPSEKSTEAQSSGFVGWLKRMFLPSSAAVFLGLTLLHAAEKPLESLAQGNPTVRSWLDYSQPVRNTIKPVFEALGQAGSWTWEQIRALKI